ncbi:MAG TPA: hypothetical protein VMW54_02055 [Terriglobia bacterium]|nr:hypothetical protein [Terriglobia bacterium]
MTPWMDLVVVFACGCILGATVSALWYKARVDVYKHLAEKHLDMVNMPLIPAGVQPVRDATGVGMGLGSGSEGTRR